MKTIKPRTLLLATLCGLAGCAQTPIPDIKPSASFAPVFAVDPKPNLATGSIYLDGQGSNFFGQQRDFQVGDVVTVILGESAQSTRTQNNTTSRKAANDTLAGLQQGASGALSASGVPLGKGIGSAIGQMNLAGANLSSDGQGNAGQQASLTGSIAVNVIEVLPNNNLSLRGEKILTLSEGSEVIQVAGVVRIEDIAPDGTVQSRRLANAQITYRGAGDLASAIKPGWGMSGIYKYWPF